MGFWDEDNGSEARQIWRTAGSFACEVRTKWCYGATALLRILHTKSALMAEHGVVIVISTCTLHGVCLSLPVRHLSIISPCCDFKAKPPLSLQYNGGCSTRCSECVLEHCFSDPLVVASSLSFILLFTMARTSGVLRMYWWKFLTRVLHLNFTVSHSRLDGCSLHFGVTGGVQGHFSDVGMLMKHLIIW